ncbi:oligopeptide/dipeptide ABC transporter ATP-binding protein [Streptomyces sp. KL116D]|uniref:oligopeptide/dipeptide ABC transporter ATP-binding protein n=1 Tax=Streptomyces sp. KL116D TaxID=3045152 RepID=UPI003556C254
MSRHCPAAAAQGLHLVFQDPSSSLDPRMTVRRIVAEPLKLRGIAKGSRPRARGRTPRPGGDCAPATRRPAPARTLRRPAQLPSPAPARSPWTPPTPRRRRARRPRSTSPSRPPSPPTCSPTSSATAASAACSSRTTWRPSENYLADRIAVMYLGQIVEQAPTSELFADPKHPYTQALLSAAPRPRPVTQRTRERIVLSGELPSPLARRPLPASTRAARSPSTGAARRCHLRTLDGRPRDLPPVADDGTAPGCRRGTLSYDPDRAPPPARSPLVHHPADPPAPSAWCPPRTTSPPSPRWPSWRTAESAYDAASPRALRPARQWPAAP